jgi:hypothetical protein
VKLNVLLFASALALAATAAHAAPQFVNGDFEDVSIAVPFEAMTPANTPGWTILDGGGAGVPRLYLNQASGGFAGYANSGRQFAVLTAIPNEGFFSAVEQTVGGFTIGETYRLVGEFSRELVHGTDRIDVTLTGAVGGGSFQEITSPADENSLNDNAAYANWINLDTTFVPTSTSVTFHFQSGNVGGQGSVGLDALQIISPAGAAPEPGAWALMLGGFGLAGAALRRRRALAA